MVNTIFDMPLPVTFGYDIVPNGEVSRLVPNPVEMAVIERMQAMRKDGATYGRSAQSPGTGRGR
jgi:hypothetical protein